MITAPRFLEMVGRSDFFLYHLCPFISSPISMRVGWGKIQRHTERKARDNVTEEDQRVRREKVSIKMVLMTRLKLSQTRITVCHLHPVCSVAELLPC